MKKSDVHRSTRLAGLVRRFHTWPCLHQQTVAEHTWQVMRLYTEIFGSPRSEVWEHLLWHDIGEIVTGDIPYPVKRNTPVLKAEMDRLENEAITNMGVRLPLISVQEHIRFKFCDLLDCAEQGQYESRLGNQYMGVVADQRNGLSAILRQMTDVDRSCASTYCVENGIQLYGED